MQVQARGEKAQPQSSVITRRAAVRDSLFTRLLTHDETGRSTPQRTIAMYDAYARVMLKLARIGRFLLINFSFITAKIAKR